MAEFWREVFELAAILMLGAALVAVMCDNVSLRHELDRARENDERC